jgi:hypothetical protein
MRRVLLLAFATLAAFAADSSWDKVRELKTGTELRIFKKGARQPVLGTMDEANDERVIVVVKNEEIAVQKDDIDRIDYRPAGKKGPTKETRTTQSDSTQTTPAGPQPPGTGSSTTTSTTTSFGSGSKPDFETIYRRTSK